MSDEENFIYIDDLSVLENHAPFFYQNEGDLLFIDTEFTRRTTYWPKLELLQFAFSKGPVYVIDVEKIQNFSKVLPLLDSPHIKKIFYSSMQDQQAIWKKFHIFIENIFDLQIAATFLGFGLHVGLSDLLECLLEQSLDKSEQFSDWSVRPLRCEQLAYAAQDVCCLRQLYPVICESLHKLNRFHWYMSYMQEKRDEFDLNGTKNHAWLRLRSKIPCDQTLFFVYHLAMYREKIAQNFNMNRAGVLKDEHLIQWAVYLKNNTEKETQDVTNFLDEDPLMRPEIRGEFKKICLTLIENFHERDRGYFESLFKNKPFKTLSKFQRQKLIDLKKIINQKAKALQLPMNVLAPQEMVENYIQNPSQDHPLVFGWRGEIFKDLL